MHVTLSAKDFQEQWVMVIVTPTCTERHSQWKNNDLKIALKQFHFHTKISCKFSKKSFFYLFQLNHVSWNCLNVPLREKWFKKKREQLLWMNKAGRFEIIEIEMASMRNLEKNREFYLNLKLSELSFQSLTNWKSFQTL